MRIVSWNVNGVRSVFKQGFLNFVKGQSPDIICLQEIKASLDKIPDDLKNLGGYFSHFNPATKRGYSGTGVFSKIKPSNIDTRLGDKTFDSEGRFLRVDYPNFVLINLYLPHGGRGMEKLAYKLGSYKSLLRYLSHLTDKPVILTGDFNIAHTELDLARPRQNSGNIMFTPQERKMLDGILDLGFSDSFRLFNKESGNYSWWPYYANARNRNLGWRLDYAFVGNDFTHSTKNSLILKDIAGSDHAPITVDLSF